MRLVAVLLIALVGRAAPEPSVAPSFTNSIGMQLVLIRPGSMRVGVFQPECPSPAQPGAATTRWLPEDYRRCEELARHDARTGFLVQIAHPYYIGKFEVTQGEWLAVMGKNPSTFQGSRVTGDANRHPVDSVSWDDAQTFVRTLNTKEKTTAYRLPTEFEWEFAGRAGGRGQVDWTDIREQAVQGLGGAGSGAATTRVVGSKFPNAWGIYDMLGNVWEWVADVYNEKLFADPASPRTGSQHVLKGGGFASDVKNTIYATHAAGPGDGWDVGFRVVRDVTGADQEGSPPETERKAEQSSPQATPSLTMPPAANEGGFRQRSALDHAAVERGQQVYLSTCAFCHGSGARGGAQGGPDLVQSAIVLGDDGGRQLGEFLRAGRPSKGMPAFNLPASQIADISTFLRDRVHAAARHHEGGAKILVGNARAGEAFFNGAGKCTACHSVARDLKGIGAKYDPVTLQGRIVLPRGHGSYPGVGPPDPLRKTVIVAEVEGKTLSGTLVAISDYYVTLQDASGNRHTVARNGDVPRVEIRDPLQAHLQLQTTLTDAQMHDLTAYLATLQ